MLRAETILASLTFKSCTWHPRARVGLVLGYEWVDVNVGKALAVGQDWGSLMEGKRAGKDYVGSLSMTRLELSARALQILPLSARTYH